MAMQRPVMDPTYVHDHAETVPSRARLFRAAGRVAWRLMRMVGRVLFYDPINAFVWSGQFRIEDSTPLRRFLKGLLLRLAMVPLLIYGVVGGIVYLATHQKSAMVELDPSSVGIYYDPVTFVTTDNVRLEGWLVPALQARHVLLNKEQALRRTYPAVVLVHDSVQNRRQMLPLVRPLHEQGYVVLVVGLRGSTSGTVGQTFGLNESQDVAAAVAALRKLKYVDGSKIALWGIGTGANACLLVAKNDSRVALILDQPVNDASELLEGRLAPRQPWLAWLRPLCAWTFEVAYDVNLQELALSQHRQTLARANVLRVESPVIQAGQADARQLDHIQEFLQARFAEKPLGQMPQAKANE